MLPLQGMGLISGWAIQIPHATWWSQETTFPYPNQLLFILQCKGLPCCPPSSQQGTPIHRAFTLPKCIAAHRVSMCVGGQWTPQVTLCRAKMLQSKMTCGCSLIQWGLVHFSSACAKNYFCLPLLHPPIHSPVFCPRLRRAAWRFGLQGKYLQRLQLGRERSPVHFLVLPASSQL